MIPVLQLILLLALLAGIVVLAVVTAAVYVTVWRDLVRSRDLWAWWRHQPAAGHDHLVSPVRIVRRSAVRLRWWMRRR